MSPATALLAVSAAHAGFQLVVTLVVYPTLTQVGPERWAEAHRDHSRRIARVVGVVYPAVAAGCLWVLLAGPVETATVAAVAGNAIAASATALVAAPTHGSLGRSGPRPALLRRLLVADRIRLLAALAALLAATVAVV